MSKYKVFREHLTTIQSAIKTSVCTVADKCFERGIVAESVYQSVVLGSKIPEERARELLIAVGDQIKTNEQLGGVFSDSEVHFIEFVKILEEEPVHKNLAKTLRNACSLSTGGRGSTELSLLGIDLKLGHETSMPVESATADRDHRERVIREQHQQQEECTDQLGDLQQRQMEEENAIVARKGTLQQTTQEKHRDTEGRDRQSQEVDPQDLLQREKMIQNLQEENRHLRQELDILTRKSLSWKTCKTAPCILKRGSFTVCGSTAYFRPAFSRQVLSYNSDIEQWSTVPDCPSESFTFTVVNGLVTAVGGQLSRKYTNTLFSLAEEGRKRKWVEHFPRMPTKRELPGVVCSGNALVVAGGEGEGRTRLTTVEVMDIDTLQWSIASSLPHPLSGASATLCGGRVYIAAGWGQPGYSTTSVFSCSLSALLQSQTVGTTFSQPGNQRVWFTFPDLPVKSSTIVTLNEQLLAVGGYDSDQKDTNNIYSYNTETTSWEVISHMPTARHRCLVAVLPGNKLMVVGGMIGTVMILDKVEFAMLQ